MKRFPCSLLLVWLATVPVLADPNVVVSAEADPEYTEAKYGTGGEPKRETYVIMRGRYFAGATVDGSIEKMTFKQILAYLTPKLTKQQYWPAKTIASADLMLVIHWGATNPRVGSLEMLARTSAATDTSNTAAGIIAADLARQAQDSGNPGFLPPENSFGALVNPNFNEIGEQQQMDDLDQVTESVLNENSDRNLAQLLGYTNQLRTMKNTLSMQEMEKTLRLDLSRERYFIIVRAYEMHPKVKRQRPTPVWIMHLNMSSPGNNFRTAMEQMSAATVNFIGRTTDLVATVKPKRIEGKVELGEPIILGEVPSAP